MAAWMIRCGLGVGLAVGVVCFASIDAYADDEPSKSPSGEMKELAVTPVTKSSLGTAPDWTKYATYSEVFGEIVTANESSITLRMYFLALAPTKTNPNQRNQRPQLNRYNGRTAANPYARRPNNQPQVKMDHHDYVIPYAPEALVRWKVLAAKLDDKGRQVPYSADEKDQARAPLGVPGYGASKGDLVPGTLVDVSLIRDRGITLDKVQDSDLRLKYVVIIGHSPTPPKAPTPAKPTTPTGKKAATTT